MELNTRETGAGTPLVLLHAFPLSSAMWLEQRNGLADCARVITPDLRGFGGSTLGADEPSLAEMADDVAAMLDKLGHDRVVLGGLSMGGYVTMAFLRRHPERVVGLVLADTKATADTTEAATNRERIATTLLEDPDSQVLLTDVLPTLVGETTVSRRALVYGRVRALVQNAPAPAVVWAERAMAGRPDSFDVLAETRVPVLVVVGEEDGLAPPSDAEAMVGALPDATLVRIPASGHLSAVETPDAFNDATRAFLSRVGSSYLGEPGSQA